MTFLKNTCTNALALWVVTLILPGMQVTRNTSDALFSQPALQEYPLLANIVMFLVLGLIFALVNAFIKPIIKFLSIPLNFITLGLFTFVINAAMLMLTAYISQYAPVQLGINSFLHTALPAAVITMLVSVLGSYLFTKE